MSAANVEELTREVAYDQEQNEKANEHIAEQTFDNYEDAYDKFVNRPDKDLPLLYLSDRSATFEDATGNPLRVTDTMLIIMIGLRGGGKTLGLAFIGALTMICGIGTG